MLVLLVYFDLSPFSLFQFIPAYSLKKNMLELVPCLVIGRQSSGSEGWQLLGWTEVVALTWGSGLAHPSQPWCWERERGKRPAGRAWAGRIRRGQRQRNFGPVFPAVTDRQMLQIEYWKINARTAAHYSARSISQPDGRWWRGVYFCFVSSWNRSAQLSTVLKAAISFH